MFDVAVQTGRWKLQKRGFEFVAQGFHLRIFCCKIGFCKFGGFAEGDDACDVFRACSAAAFLVSSDDEGMEADLVELQRKILSVVKDYVKPDGKLLYSTCTIHREENEGNVEWFLKEYPEFELVKEKQMIPGRDAGDGFYIAILKRVNHE